MLRNRLIAGLLSAVMCTTAVMPNQASESAGREANAANEKDKPFSNEFDIKATNSLGNFLNKEAEKKNVQNPLKQDYDVSQFQITSLEFDSETGIVRVASTQPTEAKIVVSFINDETNENAFSVETSVGAGKLVNSEIKADTSKLPQYYIVKAQLFDKLNRPVGEDYAVNRFTKDVQEIIATDITAFDQEQVVNLDEDETTNFLVLNEDTVQAESSEEQNTLVSADYDNNVFVFDNADETVSSLQEGELFFIQPDEENIIAVKVEDIKTNGDTVTVSGNDEIDEMFDFVKIETNADMSKAQIDASCADEGISFPNIDENGNVVINDDGSFDFTYEMPEYEAVEYEISKKKTFNLKSLLDPQTKDPHDGVIEKHGNFEGNKEVSGTLTIEGSLNFYISLSTVNIEYLLKITPALKFTLGFSGSAFFSMHNDKALSLGATIASLVLPTSVPGILIDIEPRFFVEISGNIEITVKWENIIGFEIKDGKFKNRTELFQEKNMTADMKVCGEIYAGLELYPKLVLFNKHIGSVGFDFKAGVKITVEGDIGEIFDQFAKRAEEPDDKVIITSGGGDSYHACKLCLNGTVDFIVECNMKATILRKAQEKNIITVTVPLPFLNFYASIDNGFGFGKCDYNRYRTTFMVTSTADGGYIPAVVKLDDKEATIDGYGATFYCLPGTYSYTITYEGNVLESGTITVKNTSQDKTFEENVKVDDDGKVKGYSHGDTKSVTGAPVTKAVTTKKVMVTQTLPALSSDKDQIIAETGSLGDNISYLLYPNGYLYICGHGDMYDFGSSPFRKPSTIKNVIIQNDCDTENEEERKTNIITSIGNNVFNDCTNMTSIIMPDTIKRIGNNAFKNCSSLPKLSYSENDKTPDGKLILPKSITTIGNYAFYNCSLLDDVPIPDTITEIGSYAFAGLTGITSIEIPETVKKLGEYAFSDCSALESAVIKGGADGIGSFVFSGCKSLVDLTLPFAGFSAESSDNPKVKSELNNYFLSGNGESYYVFYNSNGSYRYIPKSLKKITILDGKRISDYAFYHFNGVETITIPKTVTEIGNHAFDECSSMTSGYIPEGITSIGDFAFSNCGKAEFKDINIKSDFTYLGSKA
ncbi:leucine-rich repeat domain-containing protein, partial [Ruminococcus flavefaciens]